MKKPAKLPASAAVPPWLAEVMRPAPAPVPWPAVIRAALAVCGPLALGYALGSQSAGLLGAMGGLLGSVVDRGGPYPARIKRMAAAGICGGAAGLVLGGLVHGQGWLAVVLLVLVAGISALMSAAGATMAITSLQLLVYTILGTGPLGALRPWWWAPLLMLAGLGWAMLLLVPAWLITPLAAEQRSTADVYRALARMLRAAGTPEFPEAHQAVVTALNQAWDDLASRRVRASWPGPGAEPHRRAAAPDPPAHRGGRHPGAGGGQGSARARRHDRRDRRRHPVRHAGLRGPAASGRHSRPAGAGRRRRGRGRPGLRPAPAGGLPGPPRPQPP